MKNTKNIIGKKVSFFPANLEYRFLKKDLYTALDEVGENGQLILGPKVSEFENTIAKKVNTKYCVGCASGTDAITLALEVRGVGLGDEVIVPANAYPTVFGVALSGAKPVLIDVEAATGNLDPNLLEKTITNKTKAVVAVHLYGKPSKINLIKNISKQKKVALIEDCAQAYGSKYQEKPVGSFGDLAIFSFYPTKNLGAMGDAGAIVTNNKNDFEKLKMLRMFGEKNRYDSHYIGKNSRLDELQAAFLLVKLRYLDKWLSTRRELAKIYLKKLSHISDLHLPQISPDSLQTFHLFVIKTSQREGLRKWLEENKIDTGIHYPKPIHFTKTFSNTGKKGMFPEAEKWSLEALSLPLHPFISPLEIEYVAEKIEAYFNTN